jgi:signal transduction histidine kinase
VKLKGSIDSNLIEQNNFKPVLENFYLCQDIVLPSIGLLKEEAAAKNIQVRHPVDCEAYVLADKTRLQSVIVNLL